MLIYHRSLRAFTNRTITKVSYVLFLALFLPLFLPKSGAMVNLSTSRLNK